MVNILVEENFRYMDSSAMRAVLDAVDALGLKAEPTAPRRGSEGSGWLLALHWLPQEPLPEPAASALPAAAADIRERFLASGWTPPARVVLYRQGTPPLALYQAEPDAAHVRLTTLLHPDRN